MEIKIYFIWIKIYFIWRMLQLYTLYILEILNFVKVCPQYIIYHFVKKPDI